MNNFKLMRKLKGSYLARCKYWVVCDAVKCSHFEPHNPREDCMMLSPVKYCMRVKGFVHDIPMNEVDSNYECDPNLAFKAKRDADKRRDKEYHQGMNYRGDSHGDEYF